MSKRNMTGKAKSAPSSIPPIITGRRPKRSESCEANQTTTTVDAAPSALTHNTWVESSPPSITYEIAQTIMRPCTVYELMPATMPRRTEERRVGKEHILDRY